MHPYLRTNPGFLFPCEALTTMKMLKGISSLDLKVKEIKIELEG